MLTDLDLEALRKQVGSRYKMAVVTARRARQLNEGGVRKVLVPDKTKPTIVALLELAEGRLEMTSGDPAPAGGATADPRAGAEAGH